jgi:acylphosphatase
MTGPGSAGPALRAFSALVSGRVQGVAFRYSACHEARLLGLLGWVRNTPEGDVEVWAEGPQDKLDAFFQWLHRGPPRARVDSVRRETRRPLGLYKTFSVEDR